MAEVKLNNVLISFDMIIDTDLGLLQFMIKNNYDKFFNRSIKELNQNQLIEKLQKRAEYNPLCVFLDKNEKDIYEERNNLFKQFMDLYYNEILQESIKTSLFDLCNIWKNAGDIKVTVLCKNVEEKQLIRSKDKNLAVLIDDYNSLNLENFDSIFIKNCHSLLEIPESQLIRKGIYIADYNFNHDNNHKDIPCMDVAECVGLINEIKFIWLYAQE